MTINLIEPTNEQLKPRITVIGVGGAGHLVSTGTKGSLECGGRSTLSRHSCCRREERSWLGPVVTP